MTQETKFPELKKKSQSCASKSANRIGGEKKIHRHQGLDAYPGKVLTSKKRIGQILTQSSGEELTDKGKESAWPQSSPLWHQAEGSV